LVLFVQSEVQTRKEAQMTFKAKLFLSLVIALGSVLMFHELAKLNFSNLFHFVSLFAITLIASGLKVRVPGVTGTLSVYFLFLLIGMVRLTSGETLAIGLFATLMQCYWHAQKRPAWFQIWFNLASTSVAIVTACAIYNSNYLAVIGGGQPTRVGLAAAAFFVLNTLPVASIIGLTEGRNGVKVWKECHFWFFPYYLVGASIAVLFDYASSRIGWDAALLVLPVVYLVYDFYRQYLSRLEGEKNHAEQMAALHLRTIEALALAIDAKDHTTHKHMQRVQVYSVEIGKEMGLSADELNALEAASLLHDIGKLAVPEHIISKPGALTAEEHEKMRIHPDVGAEILERVEFPYPVAPIVRSHHERWDGTGYPAGLKGEQIPIGARILAAVNCLDALASQRPYRPALPLDQAMAQVSSESGTSFDPQVVRILARRLIELEQKANHGPKLSELAKLSAKQESGSPASGETVAVAASPASDLVSNKTRSATFLSSIAAARQEVQSLFELAQVLGQSLSLQETLSVLASRLKCMIPYDGLAIYVLRGDGLVPTYVTGVDQQLFSSLVIPVGQGLAGWVAENLQAIVNGNPSVEPGYLNDPRKFSTLQSALVVPLEAANGVIGVLALYHSSPEAFSRDQLRILQAIGPKLSVSIENAVKYSEAQDSATTDYLTGLPNARSLFVHLDGEISRAKRTGDDLAVLVCDLDGFKQVNDRFGHLAGNRLLKLIAERMGQMCRGYDYVARMGGDEFVLVLPNVKAETLTRKIAELERLARESGKVICGDEIVSLSVGSATFPRDGSAAEDLLAEADRMMYRKKQKLSSKRRVAGAERHYSARSTEREAVVVTAP
jgi:diguanylate cyclase (GGDEF)-like protein/putative nucleotidyltransferase with HDIG domain